MKRVISLIVAVLSVVFISQLYGYERIVLIEEFTSTTCQGCVKGSENMNKVVDPGNGILSLRYNLGDPFRIESYNELAIRSPYYAIPYIPYAMVCGQTRLSPHLQELQQAIQRWKSRPTPLEITVVEDRSNPSNVRVTVTVRSDESLQGLTLRVAVVVRFVELPDLPDKLPYSNGETEFYDTMLDMLPDAEGTDFSIAAGETKTFTFNYAMGSGELWPQGQIYVTAFVQNDQTKEVLQAGTDLVEYGVTLQALQRYLWVDPQGEVSTQVTVINPYSDKDLTVLLTVDEDRSLLPQGWEATVSMDTISLAAGQQQTFDLAIAAPAGAGYANVVVKVKVQVPVADGIGRIDTFKLWCLSRSARYILFSLFGWEIAPVARLVAMPEYGNYAATVPLSLTPEFLSGYPLDNFDAVVVFARGMELSSGEFDAVGTPLRDGIRVAMQQGKGVWIATGLGVFNAWHPVYGSKHAQDFWENVVGVRSSGDLVLRVQRDNQGRITGVLPFTVEGQQGDSVGDGITISYNTLSAWQARSYVFYTESFTPVSSDVVGVFYDDEDRLMGIRREDPQSGGRIVYTGFPLYPRTLDTSAVERLIKQVMRWITGKRGGDVAGMTVEQESQDLRLHIVPDDRVEFRWEGTPIVNAEIRDIRGRLVHRFGAVPSAIWQWDIRDVPSGTYFVRVETAKKSVVTPFQIVH